MVIRSFIFLKHSKSFRYFSTSIMGAKYVKSTKDHESELMEISRSIIPPLNHDLHKGQHGRIGIIGGSKEYTGAPYFAGISALKAGADLVHVFCSIDSSLVIKSYSPDLIVHPLLDGEKGQEEMKQWIDRLHSVVLGPGLGRDENVLKSIETIILYIRQKNLPLIIDADGLWLITQNPKLVLGYEKAILTPNAVEFQRLLDACKKILPSPPNVNDELMKALNKEEMQRDTVLLSMLLGNITIVRKGKADIISNGKMVFICDSDGSPRRCGGQGDLLSGFMGTFAHWAHNLGLMGGSVIDPSMAASYGSCLLTRKCSKEAFRVNGRSTTSSDLLNQINSSFVELFLLD